MAVHACRHRSYRQGPRADHRAFDFGITEGALLAAALEGAATAGVGSSVGVGTAAATAAAASTAAAAGTGLTLGTAASLAGAVGSLAAAGTALGGALGGPPRPGASPDLPMLNVKTPDFLATQQQTREATGRRGRASTILTGGGAYGGQSTPGPLKTFLGS